VQTGGGIDIARRSLIAITHKIRNFTKAGTVPQFP